MKPRSRLAPDARCVFLGLLACIGVTVLTPTGYWHRLGAEALFVLAVLALLRTPPRWLLSRLLVLLPFILVALASVPFIGPSAQHFTPWERVGAVLLRMGISFGALAALLRAAEFPRVLEALARLRVPPIFVTLMALILRYLGVLEGEAARMLRARDCRGMPRTLRARAEMAGSMVGSLFVRSFERAERVSWAMQARGFTGLLPEPAPRALDGRDWCWLIGLCSLQGLMLTLK